MIVDTETTTIENEEGEDLNYGFGYFIDHKEENKSFSIEFDMAGTSQTSWHVLTLEKGQTVEVGLIVTPTPGWSGNVIEASVNDAVTSTFSDITITHENNFSLSDNGNVITVEIMVSEHALSGTHKVLLGAYTDDIAISQFITVKIV